MQFSLHSAFLVLVSFATLTYGADPPTCVVDPQGSGCTLGRTENPDDCTKYTECIRLGSFFDTQLSNCQCPQGFYFAYTACVPGSCDVKPTCQIDPEVTFCGLGRYPNKEDCTKYSECIKLGSSGGIRWSNCECQPGHYFEPEIRGCISGQCGESSCILLNHDTCARGRFPDPDDCEKYTECVKPNAFLDYYKYTCKCAAGKYFYSHAQTCIPGTC